MVVNSLLFFFFISISIILISYKKIKELLFFAVNFFGGLIFLISLKYIFNRERPVAIYHYFNEITPSFPSGHAFMSFITYGFAGFLIFKVVKNNYIKKIYYFSSIIIVFLIGFSRIYLGVHWFSDVIGAYVSGLIWLSIMITAYEYYIFKSSHENYKKLIPKKGKYIKKAVAITSSKVLLSVSCYYSLDKTEQALSSVKILKPKKQVLKGNLSDNIKKGVLSIYT